MVHPNAKKSASARRLFLTVFLSIFLLSSCSLPWRKTPTPTLPEIKDMSTPVPEVRLDLPPTLLETVPLPGSEIGLNEPLAFTFNQPMDQPSVEAAILGSPSMSGKFSWQNNNTVSFLPDQSYLPNSQIEITITETAKASNGKNLLKPVVLQYHVSGKLEVSIALPMQDAIDVDPSSNIAVAFNQPVIALGQEQAPAAFSLQPAATGHGEWLNTSTYIFYPDPGLAGGTSYTVTINPVLTSAGGAQLDEETLNTWQFSTAKPEVLEVLPNYGYLRLDGPITVIFNIRMDPESSNQNIKLYDDQGNPVAGNFTWDESGTQVTFTPEENLQRDVPYRLDIATEAASFGGIPMQDSFEYIFRTYPAFAVYDVTDADFHFYYAGNGSLKVYFTTPLDPILLHKAFAITPSVSSMYIYSTNDGADIEIYGTYSPATQYTLSISEDLKDAWGASLVSDQEFLFQTPKASPSFTMNLDSMGYGDNLAFTPASKSHLLAQATNINYLDIGLGRMRFEDFQWFFSEATYQERQDYLPDEFLNYKQSYNLAANQNEIISVPLRLNETRPGLYFVTVKAPEAFELYSQNEYRFVLVVSNFNTVMKISPDQAFVWISAIDDQTAFADAQVTIFSGDGTILATGITDERGFFQSTIPHQNDMYTIYFAMVGSPDQPESFSMASTSWGSTSLLSDSDIQVSYFSKAYKIYTYTDRPIYRPGQTVYFKSLIRKIENGGYTLPQNESFQIEIYSESGYGESELLYATNQRVSAYGSLSGEITLSENAIPGFYRLQIMKGKLYLDTYYFDVADYRKPEIELKVTLAPEEILYGEDLKASIQADYYFGVPAANLQIDWTLYARERDFYLPGYQVGNLDMVRMYPFNDMGYGSLGRFITSGSSKTSPQGLLTLDLASDLILSQELTGNVVLTLEATIADESGLPISQRASVKMHPEQFYIGAQPQSYVGRTEEPIEFNLLTVDWDKSPVGSKAIEAFFSQITWEVEDYNMISMTPNYVVVEEVISTANPATSSKGETRLSFTPPNPGTYQLTLRSGKAETKVMIWVSGVTTAKWPELPKYKVELIPDAETYNPGQVASIFIPNPFPEEATALITVERSEVMLAEVVKLQGSGLTYQYPLTEKDIPNVYISVYILGETAQNQTEYRQGIVNLNVSPQEKFLTVTVTPTPAVSIPGGNISVVVEVKDHTGNPIQGEFSLAIIDKAILALMEPKELPIQEAFYGKQPISVMSGFSLAGYAAQMSLEAGGMGGGGADSAYPQLREEFPDTAYWNATIVTDVEGRALLSLPLPDNLTTWQINARGLTETTLVGEASAELMTQKDLMVRPQTPRFLVAGDHLGLMAIVHNNTAKQIDAYVSLQAVGFHLDDPNQQTQSFKIAANASITATWWGVVENIDAVELIFNAQAGALQDAARPVWGNLPVTRYITPMRYTTAGVLTEAGSTLEVISLPTSFTPQGGVLELELTSSLAGAIVDSLAAIKVDQYDDNISIMAGLLSNIEAYNSLNTLGIDSPTLQTNLEDQINLALHKLITNQNYDGGWHWIRSRDHSEVSDTFVTAYVLIGMERVRNAGFKVSNFTLDTARSFLLNNLMSPQSDTAVLDSQCFKIYALQGDFTDANNTINDLYKNRSLLSPWAKAMLTLTLENMNRSDSRITTLLSDLESSAIRSASGAHWETQDISWFLPGTPAFSTALAVITIAQLDPASPLLVDGVRYLMSIRQSNRLWGSIFDSAWILMALNGALKGTGDLQADFGFSSTLNETRIAEGQAGLPQDLTSINVSVPLNDLYADWPNALTISRETGSGRLYYRSDLIVYQSADSAPPINKGLSLSRAYFLEDDCSENCQTINHVSLKGGQVPPLVTVKLTLTLPNDMYNLQIEDHIPAGTEIFNPNLLTSQQATDGFGYETQTDSGYYWGWWLFNNPTVYDDHIVWTAEYLPKGTYTLTYYLVPYQAGQYQVLPAHAWQYFFPEVEGSSSGTRFEVIKP